MGDWYSLIDEALSDEDIINEIKSSICTTNNNEAFVSKSQLLDILRSKGVIDMLVSKIRSKKLSKISPSIHSGLHDTFTDINEYISRNMNASLVLVVEVLQGRAFTSHLQTYENVQNEELSCPDVNFQLHIAYKDHRSSSKIFQCTTEPVINQYFCFEIISNYTNKEKDVSFEKLLVDKPVSLVQIVIVSTSLATGRKNLIASTYFDWRPYFIGSSKCDEVNSNHWTSNASIELKSTDPNCNVSPGILDLRLSLICAKESINTKLSHSLDKPFNSNMSGVINCQPSKLKHLSPSLVQAHFNLESNRSNERENSFTNYVRQWWRELTQLREGFFSNRLIKIFATDENGNTQFVCNFVNPLSVSHILETPFTAARFVSSIPYEPFCSIGNEIKERWYSGLAFVSSNRGDIADHANLLCSLLLGYGLEAYVALGTGQFNMNKQIMTVSSYLCAWVVVCSDDYHRITFWDCITGRRYIHTISCCEQNLYPSPFYSVGCLYNNNSFYANIQPTDKVDSSHWRPMSSEVIQTVHKHSSLYLRKLNPSIQPVNDITVQCRESLRRLANNWRIEKLDCQHKNDILWKWDNKLGQLLLPLIAKYEADLKRLSNYADSDTMSNVYDEFDNDFIISPIHRHIPKDHLFKSYSIQLFHCDPQRILRSCLRSQLCRDILGCRGDHVQLALSLRIIAYAENAIVTWVIFACSYKSII
ncbi:Centrosomal protein of 76 kDa [Schistosoma japonicum]|nr:Centrosomal protein of 76 kDa [Schistosoma japonicum]